MAMTKSVQVWWNGKLNDIVSDAQALQMIKDGVAVQISENAVKITQLGPY
jgi:hypothetical protein